ncbi:MAG: hydrolase, partial [Bosea sp. (in: a-proteobacteria)]
LCLCDPMHWRWLWRESRMRRLRALWSHLLVVDVQARLTPALAEPAAFLAQVKLLLAAARELDVPVTVTEQYPAGLGHTVPEVTAALPAGIPVLEKITFSALEANLVRNRLDNLRFDGREQLVVCGAEAHVCVLQTVMAALDAGYPVAVVTDAVASRKQHSHEIALQRMQAAGATLVTTEMVCFEWLGQAGTDSFKRLIAQIK